MESLKIAIYLGLIGLSLYQCSAEDGAAIQYTSDTFKEDQGSKPLFVKFYAPWCGHCKRLAPVWEELAAQFNVDDQKVVIGKVDCTVETALCSENGVTGYPTLKFFNADGEDTKYKGGRDVDALAKYVREQVGGGSPAPAAGGAGGAVEADNGLYVLTADNFDAHIATGMHFIKFYAPWCGHCKRLAPVWDELAAKYGKDAAVKIAKVDCTKDQAVCGKLEEVRGYPTLLFFQDGKIEKYPSGRDMASFDAYIAQKSGKATPPAPKKEEAAAEEKPSEGLLILTAENIKESIDSEKTTFVKFFAPWCGHCKNMAQDYIKFAAKYANAKGVQIAEVDCTKHKACGDYGVQGFPTLKVFRAGVELGVHRGARDVASMSKYLEENVLDGQLEGAAADPVKVEAKSPAKEEAVPPTDEENGLVVLTDATFDSFAQTTKTTFVKFYAPWCGHCKRLAPDWSLLAKSFMDNDSVVIAKVDCTENRNICTRYGVKGYPTLKLFRAGQDLGEHNGARSVEALQQFVKDNFVDEKETEKAEEKKDEL